MYEVTLIQDFRLSYTVEVCGKTIELTKRKNKISSTDTERLSALICEIDHAITNRQPLNGFVSVINGGNVLRIMESLFYSQAYSWWTDEYPQYLTRENSEFKTVFHMCFGFRPPTHGKENLLLNEVRKFATTSREEVKLSVIRCDSAVYMVKKVSTDGNVVTFHINGMPITICLSGRRNMQSAAELLFALHTIRDGFSEQRPDRLKEGIFTLGPTAALDFIESHLCEESQTYFLERATHIVHKNRTLIAPRKLLKEYFGSSCHRHIHSLLDALESALPEYEEYLVRSTADEICTHKREWILYERRPAGIRQYTVHFAGPDTLVTECQEYLRTVAQRYIMADRPYASHLYDIANRVYKAINILHAELMVDCDSILKITALQVRLLLAYLAQHSGYSPREQRSIYVYLHAFYGFYEKRAVSPSKSPFGKIKFPKVSSKHVPPVAGSTLYAITHPPGQTVPSTPNAFTPIPVKSARRS